MTKICVQLSNILHKNALCDNCGKNTNHNDNNAKNDNTDINDSLGDNNTDISTDNGDNNTRDDHNEYIYKQ